jgi:hypothetical protein
MEYLRRKCVCCHKLYYLSCVNGNYKTCILCLEKAKETYRDDPETVIRRCKKHRDNNVEKEKERHRLYYCNNKEIIDEKKKVYNHLEYYCPVCLYNVKFYRQINTVNLYYI